MSRSRRFALPAVVLTMAAVAVTVVLVAGGDEDTPEPPEAGTAPQTETDPEAERPPGDPADAERPPPGSARFYRAATLQPVVEALADEAGSRPQVISADLAPTRMRFELGRDGAAAGFEGSLPDYSNLRRVDAEEAGGTFLNAASFPLETLDPALPERLVAEVDDRERGRFRPSGIRLVRDNFGDLEWTVLGSAGKGRRRRGVAYVADADGSNLRTEAVERRRDTRAARRGRRALPPRIPISSEERRQLEDRVRELEDCLREAERDRERVEACNQEFQERFDGG